MALYCWGLAAHTKDQDGNASNNGNLRHSKTEEAHPCDHLRTHKRTLRRALNDPEKIVKMYGALVLHESVNLHIVKNCLLHTTAHLYFLVGARRQEKSTASVQLTLCCRLEVASWGLLHLGTVVPVRNLLLHNALVEHLAGWEQVCRIPIDCADSTIL